MIGTSGLNLPGALVEHGRTYIDEMAHERQEYGYTVQRCFTHYRLPPVPPLNQPIGIFDVTEHPEAYDVIYPQLVEILANRGQYIDFVADTGYLPGHGEKLLACLAATGKPALVSRVNEGDRVGNDKGGPVWTSDPGPHVYTSQGSNSSDSWPPEPALKRVEYHIIGSEWQRKVGHNAMELADTYGVPAITTETPRAGEHYVEPRMAEEAARNGALLCAGAYSHSAAGKSCAFFPPSERPFHTAWCRGALSVPLRFQRGRYIHRTDLEGIDPADGTRIIRAHSRRLQSGEEYVSIVHEEQ